MVPRMYLFMNVNITLFLAGVMVQASFKLLLVSVFVSFSRDDLWPGALPDQFSKQVLSVHFIPVQRAPKAFTSAVLWYRPIFACSPWHLGCCGISWWPLSNEVYSFSCVDWSPWLSLQGRIYSTFALFPNGLFLFYCFVKVFHVILIWLICWLWMLKMLLHNPILNTEDLQIIRLFDSSLLVSQWEQSHL